MRYGLIILMLFGCSQFGFSQGMTSSGTPTCPGEIINYWVTNIENLEIWDGWLIQGGGTFISGNADSETVSVRWDSDGSITARGMRDETNNDYWEDTETIDIWEVGTVSLDELRICDGESVTATYSGPGTVTGYQYRVSGSSSWSTFTNGATSLAVVYPASSTHYEVRIAVNICGTTYYTSPRSTEVFTIPDFTVTQKLACTYGQSIELEASAPGETAGDSYWFENGVPIGEGTLEETIDELGIWVDVYGPRTFTVYFERSGQSTCRSSTLTVTTGIEPSTSEAGELTVPDEICYQTIPEIHGTPAVEGNGTLLGYLWEHSTDGSTFTSIDEGEGGFTDEDLLDYPQSITQDTWFRRTSRFLDNCGGNMNITRTVKQTVAPVLSAGSIDTNQIHKYCEDNPVITSISPASGGLGALTYQWEQSTSALSGWTNATGSSTSLSYTIPSSLDQDMYFRRKVTDVDCSIPRYTDHVFVDYRNQYDQYPTLTLEIVGSNDNRVCQNQSLQFSATTTDASNASTIKWYKNDVEVASETGNSSTYSTSSFAHEDVFKVTLTPYPASCYPHGDLERTIALNVVDSGMPASVTAESFGPGTIAVYLPEGNSYKWYDSGSTLIHESDDHWYEDSYSADAGLEVKTSACQLHTGTTVNVEVYPVPQLSLNESNYLNDGVAPVVTLSNVSSIPNGWISWYHNDQFMTTPANNTHTVTSPGTYKVKVVTNEGLVFETEKLRVYEWQNAPNDLNNDRQTVSEGAPASVASRNVNFVRTYQPRIGIAASSGSSLDLEGGSLNKGNVQVVTNYADGLGRDVQSVGWQASPGGYDMVSPIVYDAQGRQPRTYLPYAADAVSGTSGAHRPNALLEQYNFYHAANDNVVNIDNPYASVLFESSPSGRALEQAGPGESWYPGANWDLEDRKTVKSQLRSNRSVMDGNIIIWTKSAEILSNSGTYSDHQLTVAETQDENGAKTREYTNKKGQTILKRSQGSKNQWLDTYYVYDNFDNLVFVIPPQAFKEIDDNSYTDIGPIPEEFVRLTTDQTYTSSIAPDTYYYNPGVKVTLGAGFSFTGSASNSLRIIGGTVEEGLHYDYLFAYEYDDKNRMIAKKVPGSGWTYLVYDQLDRLVLTQDANQRANDEWAFTNYDALNRPVMTGIYTDTRTLTDIRTAVLTEYGHEDRLAGAVGYSLDQSFPGNDATVTLSDTELRTITYYDDYAFTGYTNWDAEANTWPNDQTCTGCFAKVKGQITGAKVKDLVNDTWLNSTTYYDDEYQVIAVHSQNHTGSVDVTTNTYDFSGNLKSSTTVHNGHESHTVTREFDYDHLNRLVNVWHTFNTDPRILIANNQYNELGELIDKSLHSENQGTDYLQSVDYLYNARGWLTDINNHDLSPQAGDDEDDLFGMKLLYDDKQANLNFNGNISGMRWTSGGASEAKTYGFVYDELNRIHMADYRAGANFTANLTDHEMRIREYDLNGNIIDLQRNNPTAVSGVMDNLDYEYEGNQLTAVSDSGDDDSGFREGTSQPIEYLYDANGNMTSDVNKDITSIDYNYLNLPEVVTFGDDKRIEYTYDASGIKLRQQVFANGGIVATKTTDYIGEFIYEDSVLQIVQHEEGRLVPNTDGTAGWEYQYHLKDHLGNVRTTFTSEPRVWPYTATMETDAAAVAFEELYFQNMTTRSNSRSNANVTPSGAYSAELNTTTPVGPSISLSVGPGDQIDLSVFAYYENNSAESNRAGISSLATLIASSITAIPGVVIEGSLEPIISGEITGSAFLGGTVVSENSPAAYLNWMVFDQEYQLIDAKTGFQRVAPDKTVSDPPHELTHHIDIEEAGYLFVYVSNETANPSAFVHFDDLTITHTESAVVQSDGYYPFGLAFNSYQRVGNERNRFLYNGKEEQELTYWLDYGARMFNDELGKFFNIDRRSHNYMMYSPYAYAVNNPVNNIDYDGDFILPKEYVQRFGRAAQYLKNGIQGVLENSRIVNALKNNGGFSDEQLRSAFTWGEGPVLTPSKMANSDVLGVTGGLPGNTAITINIDLFEALEQAEGKDRDYALFLLAVTILHEFVHAGYIENQIINDALEEGLDFEREAYGEIINRNNYKQFLDKWLNRQSSRKQKRADSEDKGGAVNRLINNFGSLEEGEYQWDGIDFVKEN